VLFGAVIGNGVNAASGDVQQHTLLALGVLGVTLVMLPPLHNRLARLLKNHVYLTTLVQKPEKEQTQIIGSLNLAEPLTARETEVMRLLIRGKTYKAIAAELFVSENTIRTHVKSIYYKAGVTSRAELSHLMMNPPNIT